MISLQDHEDRIKAIENEIKEDTDLLTVHIFKKTLTVTAGVWLDTGIILPTGTYIVQIYVHTAGYGSSQWNETYSGICSSHSSSTNSSEITEIPLTNAGHAPNNGFIVMGFKRYPVTNNTKTCFCISSNTSFVDCPITFYFRKVL